MTADNLTPEQAKFLAAFADNALNGRRFLCIMAHILAWFGGVATVVGSLAGGALAVWTLWQRLTGQH